MVAYECIPRRASPLEPISHPIKMNDITKVTDLDTIRLIFKLILQDDVFLSSWNRDRNDWDDGIYLAILCNDFFFPAADAETLDLADIRKFHEVIKAHPDFGALAWCYVKRNCLEPFKPLTPDESRVKFDEAVDFVKSILSK